MKTRSKLISEKEIRSIFSELHVIALYSQTFLADLEERRFENRLLPRPCHAYGDIFSTMSHFCRSYVQYINNYNAAMTTLCSAREKEEFSNWITKQERTLGEPLDSVLITPIQRIPRYVLLLSELVRHTPIGYSDRPQLVESLDRMKELAVSVNESKREAEHMQELMRIYYLLFPLPPNFILPHRRFIIQGELFYFEKDGDLPKPKWAFLFSDILLITRKIQIRRPSAGILAPPSASTAQHSAVTPRGSVGIGGTPSTAPDKGNTDLIRYQLQIYVSLQNVTSVLAIGGGGIDVLTNCFVVDTSKGITLMFHCQSELDQQVWVSQLNERIKLFSMSAGTRRTVEIPSSRRSTLESLFRPKSMA